MEEQLSKTIQLGVIILALELLGKLGFSLGRIVRAVAARLGISRPAGYKAAAEIRRTLAAAESPAAEGKLHRELISLRIQNQILAYERDHPGVRFERDHKHLPRDAKALCVRLLREYRAKLSLEEIAQLVGIAPSSLRRWDHQADSRGEIPPKPELRGRHRRASPEDVERVLEELKALEGDLSLEEFTQRYNEKHPQRPLDRKTITRILQSEGLRAVEIRNDTPKYHPSFKVYFPGAQASLDAKEIKIRFKTAPEEVLTVTKEVVVDIASGAVLGDALEKQETAEGVIEAVLRARQECAGVLAFLADNGSGNRSGSVKRLLEADGSGQIFSFPVHPQTNGHIEGFFGQFSRIVGPLEVDDSSREALASSIAEIVFRVFAYFHNHSPRRRLGGLSPLEYLRSYCPGAEEIQAAREGLGRQKDRSEALRQEAARLRDPVFRSLVERVLERHRFGGALEPALKALAPYDLEVVESASAAFSVSSQRQGFDERKRTFAYFMGIVRNKQKEVDEARAASEIGRLKAARVRAESEAAQRQVLKDRAEEKRLLRADPEALILQAVDMLLRGSLRFGRELWLGGLRRGLEALGRLGRGTLPTRERLAARIQSWAAYGEELKQRVLEIFFAEYQAVLGRAARGEPP